MNLKIFNTANLFDAANNLFAQLGIKLNSNTAEPLPLKDLLKQNYKDNETFGAIGKTFFIGIIDDSVFKQPGMFDVPYSYKDALQQADKSYNGLMLFALELSEHPNRSEISELTRAFNRISQKMPVALVLKYTSPPTPLQKERGENPEAIISISISERFKYKQDWRQGEKAGKVIILRDIKTQQTHAGHHRILLDLVKPVGVTNYAQLQERWLQVLDVSLLNKKFFQELANWYFWAMDNVQFPDDIEKKKDVRNATNLIRLITRVIFIWFIKEKNLVPANLFRKDFLNKIIKDFAKDKKSENYYQAILQNLFFGTLNQKMNERGFVKEGNFQQNKTEYGVKNLFRYADKFSISEKEVMALFKDVPFLNGGLFDCLDKPNEAGTILYVDGFSRNTKRQATVPDYLFFGDETEVDLNEIYATRNKTYKSKGLVNILESYKFTVAENTPIEEEIALDPELLGKVFENLLASYNPETQTTARKQTGSFYTPREIVNYMVDESLLEYLKSTVSIPADVEQANIRGDVDTFFDPQNEIQIHTGNLPHWQQENAWYFITFRLADSIPADVAEEIKSERELWLQKNPKGKDGNYSKEQLKEYYRLFSERVEKLLNAGKGSCVLRDGKTAKIVADALLHFNNQRYVLDEWVIMPNHVHVLVKPLGEYKLPDILHSWKSFTANKINEQLGNKGQLWMHESYDHIVRNEKAFEAIKNYIRQNPLKAGISLPDGARSAVSIPADGLNENRSRDASETFENRLRDLFSYSDPPAERAENANPFNTQETKLLIEAINNCKILDPACGSGAFPMGVLHKMVHILTKLDPDNTKWKAEQEEKIIGDKIKELEKDKYAIEGLSDAAVKEKARKAVDERLKEIKEIFKSENNFDDYARKLFLIENCIYGIDIQPIAVQIAKLRFFISLIIDQNKQEGKDNFGIRSLPNLETKFVAANSLISLDKPEQGMFRNPDIEEKEKQLKELRHNYFTAKTRREKIQYQAKDNKLRKEIAKLLEHDGWNTTVAKQIVAFDPYDQNLSAPFFESEWMFGLTDGFDIVIGNPPYGADLSVEQINYFKNNYKLKTSETAILFIEKGLNNLKVNGFQTYIIPKSFTFASNYEQTRNFVIDDLRFLVDCGKAFENVKLEACVFGLKKKSEIKFYKSLKLSDDLIVEPNSIIDKSLKTKFGFFPNGLTEFEINLGNKIIDKSILLATISNNSRGEMLQDKIQSKGKFPIIGGKEINKFYIRGIKGYINDASVITEKSKIHSNSILAQNIVAHITQPHEHLKIIACLPDKTDYLIVDTINQITITDKNFTEQYLWCLLNSKLINWYCYLFILAKAIRTIHFDNSFTSRIPILEISKSTQKPFIALVDKILSAKEKNPDADTSKLEKQLDEMVYKLYDLTEEEIKIVEGK